MPRSSKTKTTCDNNITLVAVCPDINIRRNYFRNFVPAKPLPNFKPNPPYSTYRNK